MFQFKQFSILQEKSAMKVGTDGVLLGSWTPINNENTVLDIGTGTGLIALMLAQRSSSLLIDALEVDNDAYTEAVFNFENSIWKERLNPIYTSLELFHNSKHYDLIVCNPPYYTDTYTSQNKKRTLARHVDGLTFELLLEHTNRLLSKVGKCSFILPFKEQNNFIDLAKHYGLFLVKQSLVKGRVDLPYKRCMLLFGRVEEECQYEELIIEIDRHKYTDSYIALTKEFYLKM